MLHGTYKGDLFEALNEISKLSEEIENSEVIEDQETLPVNVEVCDTCGHADCECEECEEDEHKVPSPDGSAGYQDENSVAVFGSEKSDKVGKMSTAQVVEESMVNQVQSIIKSNMERTGRGDFDPLNFFKEPIKVDMYEPVVKYGDEMM